MVKSFELCAVTKSQEVNVFDTFCLNFVHNH